jgi:hypothetical protein
VINNVATGAENTVDEDIDFVIGKTGDTIFGKACR